MPNTRIQRAVEDSVLTDGYPDLLHRLKEHIRQARIGAVLAVNRELVILYWRIGRDILAEQTVTGWGHKVGERIASDLQREFPDMMGLSRRNMTYMRTFAAAYPEFSFIEDVFGVIPWGHNVLLLDKLRTLEERVWYARQTSTHGWSRSMLRAHIDTRLYERQGVAPSNFDRTLPAPLAMLAQQVTRDPLVFELPGWEIDSNERALEQTLVDRVRNLLLGLGMHLAFVANQYHLRFDERDYYLDLLLYDLKLHSYLVVELKRGEFRPEYLGQLNFYLEVVDTTVRDPAVDRPSIGLLVCQSKRTTTVEVALRTTTKPVAVSSYEIKLRQALTERLQAAEQEP